MTEQQQIELGKRLVQGDCLRLAGKDLAAGRQASEIILSIESDDWIRARAVEHEGMQATLATLDAALAKTAGVRLSIEDELKKQARLYGAGTVCPVPAATTEVGRLANIMEPTDASELFGQPETGSTSSGALDTAKAAKQRAKGKFKGGRKRQRSLPKSLRIKSTWKKGK
jgi:hypothetical protein